MEIQLRLSNLGYIEGISKQVFADGPPDTNFINVIAWLNSELVKLCKLESFVNCDIDAEDSISFFVEVSSLLKELSCPYKCLTKGNISERFTLFEHKRLLITYLCTELEAAKIQTFKKPKNKNEPIKIKIDESKTAKELKKVFICLYSKIPAAITTQQVFNVIEEKLKDLSQPSTPKEKVGKLLFTECLTEKQWFHLECLYKEMYQEYKVRRDLLLTRLEVTIKSFLWSDVLETKSAEIVSIYEKYKSGVSLKPMVKISDILAAKPNLAVIEKTSSAAVQKNTKSIVKNILIGGVPDRGGRPEEQQPPPPEVPRWQENNSFSKMCRLSNPPSTSRGRKNASNKTFDNALNEYPSSHASISVKDTVSKGNRSRRIFNPAVQQSVYQPRYQSGYNPVYESSYHNAQLENRQFGFGGYMTAGNNYQYYGTGDQQFHQRIHDQAKAPSHRSGLSKRSGHSYRSSN